MQEADEVVALGARGAQGFVDSVGQFLAGAASGVGHGPFINVIAGEGGLVRIGARTRTILLLALALRPKAIDREGRIEAIIPGGNGILPREGGNAVALDNQIIPSGIGGILGQVSIRAEGVQPQLRARDGAPIFLEKRVRLLDLRRVGNPEGELRGRQPQTAAGRGRADGIDVQRVGEVHHRPGHTPNDSLLNGVARRRNIDRQLRNLGLDRLPAGRPIDIVAVTVAQVVRPLIHRRLLLLQGHIDRIGHVGRDMREHLAIQQVSDRVVTHGGGVERIAVARGDQPPVAVFARILEGRESLDRARGGGIPVKPGIIALALEGVVERGASIGEGGGEQFTRQQVATVSGGSRMLGAH